MTITAYDLTNGQDPMTYGEIDALRDLAGQLPGNPIIVNIGAADGVSTVCFLGGCPDAFVYSVDVEECPQEFANVEAAGLDRTRVVRLLGRSQDIGGEFPYEADLVFVDGGHDYESVKGDIESWAWKVRPGGALAFHDYIPGENPPGNPGEVYEAVTENLPDGFELIGQTDRLIAFRREGA